ncbi:MAG TPA: hypothetical protein VFP64_06415 [Pyrinomonadaceae bacterium]|nr:hypothetical protein [Pyrinomonadaceae bacterium]
MRNISPTKLSALKPRHLFSLLIFVLAISPCTFGQTKKSAAKAAPEDVYFNADGREISAPSTLAANQMSANSIGRQLSVLFDSARVSLQTESDPMVATWVGTVSFPIKPGAKPKPKAYIQHIRASVNKSADTRITIFLELGGKGFVVEFPYGMKYDGDITRRFLSSIKPAASERYTASIVIFAERRYPKSALLVDIDSLDVVAP